MGKYFEQRKTAARGTDSVAADMMRHLHTRQYLGKAVVLTEQPAALLSAGRKQWLKLSRAIQKQRASTLNADKLLKYTHTITHMQHMRFGAKQPYDDPETDVYFLRPDELRLLPSHCFTLYVETPPPAGHARTVVEQLPPDALVVDYTADGAWPAAGLLPKSSLEAQVRDEWEQMQHFLLTYQIDTRRIFGDSPHNIDAMDDALDTLLGVGHAFLQHANEFQRALELARPLKLQRTQRQEFDALILLAHRVQALSPGVFTQRFLETYNEDDTFFLNDPSLDLARRSTIMLAETLAEAIARHTQANRIRLATALFALKTLPAGVV